VPMGTRCCTAPFRPFVSKRRFLLAFSYLSQKLEVNEAPGFRGASRGVLARKLSRKEVFGRQENGVFLSDQAKVARVQARLFDVPGVNAFRPQPRIWALYPHLNEHIYRCRLGAGFMQRCPPPQDAFKATTCAHGHRLSCMGVRFHAAWMLPSS